MKSKKMIAKCFVLAIAILMTAVFLNRELIDRQVMANDEFPSLASAEQQNLRKFAGCWSAGAYSLYIPTSGDRGKIRHGESSRSDPQMIYDIKVSGSTITGKWMSDPEFKSDKNSKGQKRRGTFSMTRSGNALDGIAHEDPDSEVVEWRGTDWPWNWALQTDSDMCEQ